MEATMELEIVKKKVRTLNLATTGVRQKPAFQAVPEAEMPFYQRVFSKDKASVAVQRRRIAAYPD